MSKKNRENSPSMLSLTVPAALLVVLGVTLSAKLGLFDPVGPVSGPAIKGPETVVIEPRQMRYRAEGHFLKRGLAVDAPLVDAALRAPFAITKYQVSRGEYRRCVEDGACEASEAGDGGEDVPVTGVNYRDAENYAKWLTAQTGEVWRLPTDEQWAFAAGSKFPDDALGIDAESDNPALRWLADYEREAGRQKSPDPRPRPRGTFGENEYGVADLGGNVWEWTRTCHRRVTIGDGGKVLKEQPACGIYVVDGKHRASMSFFIREPKSGGCAVGVPPDNLGFRLVRDDRWYARLLYAFERRRGGAV
ncbi:formylglycine-generating enzyme family protein [Sinorhizobium psoraleae]|uniref:Formylglycine-generating enzyme family protein n=1 Tax=Sinorhizobium psoraleae TaxID=520838 RepID=A0ABT4KQY4_9HYPH|nr:formylglycine-generating enzyme family protein [Sinorhizobium psoraleae]MCZ4094342.1 formylglycine-generating enzyme family protein [Sinorhizobium psoraleae]